MRALPGQDVGQLSLRFTIDGRVADVGAAPGVRYLYPPCEQCPPNGLEVDLPSEMVRALAHAKTVQAHVLGEDVEFSPEDQAGLRQFVIDIGLEPEP